MANPPLGALRLVLSGKVGSTEEWATGFWVSGSGAIDEATLKGIVDSVAGIWSSTIKTPTIALCASDTSYEKWTGYNYDGTSPRATFVASSVLATTVGSSGVGTVNPMQTCMVLSLHTGFSGARSRGRMFLPATGISLSGHRFSDSHVDNLADGWAAGFTAIGALTSIDRPVVLSLTGGTFHPLTSVSADNKPDIQRRRANHFSSSHTHTTAVT